jgi:Xaa-Pro aminopeptidase
MFPANVYTERRQCLRDQIESGLILLLGNQASPMNYADNQYPFRQDSSFLYFFGLDLPGLAAMIDVDQGEECVFGDDLTLDDIIWMGPQPLLKERCEKVGISATAPFDHLQNTVKKAMKQGKKVHFLPPYRADSVLLIQRLLGIAPAAIQQKVSEPLIKAVVAQRSLKTPQEIAQIEAALDISYEMHVAAMKSSKPGLYERQIAGMIEGIAVSRGSRLAFPTIFSIHGETLHNHYYGNVMKAGDMAVLDCGAESTLYYASDITRTIPISGRFSARQKEIYSLVLEAQEKAIAAVQPGIEFREIHRLACAVLASGLKELGLMKGDVDEAVHAGAHALFFQCGLGHMLGLDVHDMEALGEDYVGYTETIKRKDEFGWRSLRLAKALEPGFVITVEPGLYFIAQLIDLWKSTNKCADFINYDKVEHYRDFGGIRIEDDVAVMPNGHKILGRPVPKSIEEVQEATSG